MPRALQIIARQVALPMLSCYVYASKDVTVTHTCYKLLLLLTVLTSLVTAGLGTAASVPSTICRQEPWKSSGDATAWIKRDDDVSSARSS